ncbi:hypothetical protein FGF1_19920 [Flavobacteriaceae bacterium GF1]
MDIDNNLKYNIEYILKNRKLTQSDLGKLIGSNQRQISNWLTGKTRVPIEMLVAIAANFDLSTDKLLFDRLDNPYSQDAAFEKANQGMSVSDYNEEGPVYTKTEESEAWILIKKLVRENTELKKKLPELLSNHLHNDLVEISEGQNVIGLSLSNIQLVLEDIRTAVSKQNKESK